MCESSLSSWYQQIIFTQVITTALVNPVFTGGSQTGFLFVALLLQTTCAGVFSHYPFLRKSLTLCQIASYVSHEKACKGISVTSFKTACFMWSSLDPLLQGQMSVKFKSAYMLLLLMVDVFGLKPTNMISLAGILLMV